MAAKHAPRRKGHLAAVTDEDVERERGYQRLQEQLEAVFRKQREEFARARRLLEEAEAQFKATRRPVKAKRRPRAYDGGDPAAQATQRYRKKMRGQGMKLVQLWVPDPEAAGYRAECERQSGVIAKAAADPTTDEVAVNRALAAHASEVLAGEPEYDWGPEGPPK